MSNLQQGFYYRLVSPTFDSKVWSLSFTVRLLVLTFEEGNIYHCSVVRMHSNNHINLTVQSVGMACYFILHVMSLYVITLTVCTRRRG
jgi:hypothetical protein